jgi:uncharacterized PurR-regulated membrane protein YhhQ (DUF165 family)
VKNAVLILLYIATIPAANWLIGHVGTVCIPDGPCLIPVLPGIMAPSGVLMIGSALVLRDLVQRSMGARVSLACILAGAALSFFVAPPALALASAGAFLFSELIDFAVYTPLARRSFALAVLTSCTAGALADSAIFLWLAFGSLAFIGGQFVGKLYAALVYLAFRERCRVGFHDWHADMSEAGQLCDDYGGCAEECARCGAKQSTSNR